MYFVKWLHSNLTKFLIKSCFYEISAHCAQCGNYGNLLSHFFGKNFVKITVLLLRLLNSWFDEIFFGESKFISFSHCAVEIQLSHIYAKNFVKATFLLIKLLNNWFDEIFFGESKFIIFPHCALYSIHLFFSNLKITWNQFSHCV